MTSAWAMHSATPTIHMLRLLRYLIQAFKFSHLSRDPESDAIIYDDYQEMLADELDRISPK